MKKDQVAEEERIQETVRAKFNPRWRQHLDRHRRTLGVKGPLKIKGTMKQFAKQRNLL